MSSLPDNDNDNILALSAEEVGEEDFGRLHRFSAFEKGIIAQLCAHGPVLLRGGRGTGKSALMIQAARTMSFEVGHPAIGVYSSFRYLQLLESSRETFEAIFCRYLSEAIDGTLVKHGFRFSGADNILSIRTELNLLSEKLDRRFVLLLDDIAHLGRETSLDIFFDLLRATASGRISCKAAIYPGITKFGTRFDVMEDATILDVSRNEDLPGYNEHFLEVMNAWHGDDLPDDAFKEMPRADVAGFIGRAVLGNMRAFIRASRHLSVSHGGLVGLNVLTDLLVNRMAADHFWPLFEELRGKLGPYEQMIPAAEELASTIFEVCGKSQQRKSIILLREISERLQKPLGILEYCGFISRREASRGMKSGGRGTRFVLNLCNLLEASPGSRLTQDLYDRWRLREKEDPLEFHRSSKLQGITIPALQDGASLPILDQPISRLLQGNAFPFGLTENLLHTLEQGGFRDIRDLAKASDQELDGLANIGPAKVKRIRSVVGQAVWM